jgi:hypothetical protein
MDKFLAYGQAAILFGWLSSNLDKLQQQQMAVVLPVVVYAMNNYITGNTSTHT